MPPTRSVHGSIFFVYSFRKIYCKQRFPSQYLKDALPDDDLRLKLIRKKFESMRGMTSGPGQEHLKKAVANLEDAWNAFKSHVGDVGLNLENVLQQWSSYEENVATIQKWLSDIDDAIKRPRKLCLGSDDKRSRVDDVKGLMKKIDDYEVNIDGFSDQSHALLHWSGDQQIRSKVAQVNSHYQSLKKTVQVSFPLDCVSSVSCDNNPPPFSRFIALVAGFGFQISFNRFGTQGIRILV